METDPTLTETTDGEQLASPLKYLKRECTCTIELLKAHMTAEYAIMEKRKNAPGFRKPYQSRNQNTGYFKMNLSTTSTCVLK